MNLNNLSITPMAFAGIDTFKHFEGKFMKWHDGVARVLQLKGITTEMREKFGEMKSVTDITVKCMETGEEKVFSANRNFMKRLAPIDERLTVGSIIKVVPKKEVFTGKDGKEIENFDFDIQVME